MWSKREVFPEAKFETDVSFRTRFSFSQKLPFQMNRQSYLLAFLLFFFCQNLFSQARYLEPVFDQVTKTPNVLYGTNATMLTFSQLGQATPQPLVLDLYEPVGDTLSARPLVIVLPGGQYLPPAVNGTCVGAKTDSAIVEICNRLAKMGYVAAAMDYRLGWNPVSPDQQIRLWTLTQALYRGIQDARTAIRFFKRNAVEDFNSFRIDTSRIVLWGESAGGQIALGAAYANDYADWLHPELITPVGPIIMPQLNGNIWGTDYGVVPADFPIPGIYALGDTLCYPNWPGYSSDFQLCVSMAGLIPDLPWVAAGEMPAVLFHAPNDLYQPCDDGILQVGPPIILPIIPVSGSCSLAEQLDSIGNNQVFSDADLNDCVSTNAYDLTGGLEGFYPFIGLDPAYGRPWHWVSSCGNGSLPPATDAAFARQYLDTVLAFFAPRACAALGLCNAQSQNPGGLCQPSILGKVYMDLANDGYTTDDRPFPGIVLELQPGNLHAVSNSAGNYVIGTTAGDYTLSVPNPPAYFTSSNGPLSITFLATADTVLNVGIAATTTVSDLIVTLTPTTDPRPGFYNTLDVRWKNIGTTPVSGTATLILDANYNIESSDASASITGNFVTWEFNNLLPFQQGEGWVSVRLPPTVTLGTLLGSVVTAELSGSLDVNLIDNTASIRETVIGSYDPNDKRVTPEGDVTEDTLASVQNWLDYTVRFQNTGTASAINVFIVDTISELLNINTLQTLGASHPMRWEISGERTVTWFFDNINLPDSVNNEPASHGYVRYRIQPEAAFPELLNKTVYNFADIYFDFNEPVRTNTTETKFVLPTSAVKSPIENGLVQISPNPAREQITISCPVAANEAELSIFDVSGKMMLNRRVAVFGENLKTTISINDLPKGTYVVKVRGGLEIRAGRFVRE
jgi:uncharacterized repeat protein (TIGR01451 family)